MIWAAFFLNGVAALVVGYLYGCHVGFKAGKKLGHARENAAWQIRFGN